MQSLYLETGGFMSVSVNLYSIIVTQACCSDLRPPRSHTYLLSTPSEGKSELLRPLTCLGAKFTTCGDVDQEDSNIQTCS